MSNYKKYLIARIVIYNNAYLNAKEQEKSETDPFIKLALSSKAANLFDGRHELDNLLA